MKNEVNNKRLNCQAVYNNNPKYFYFNNRTNYEKFKEEVGKEYGEIFYCQELATKKASFEGSRGGSDWDFNEELLCDLHFNTLKAEIWATDIKITKVIEIN